MATITIRSSYAFDPETVAKIKKLAQAWGVSQSEAIRRAVRKAEMETHNPYAGMTPLEILDHLQKYPLLTKEEADRRIQQMNEERKTFFDRDEP